MKCKFKSIFTLLLVITLVAVSSLPAFAAKTVNIKMNVSREEDKVYVSFTVPKNSNLSTLKTELKFNSEKLSFNTVTYLSGDDKVLTMTDDKSKDSGSVTANYVNARYLKDECEIFKFEFDAVDLDDGNITFKIGKLEASDSQNKPLNIKIKGKMKYDLNKLDSQDNNDTNQNEENDSQDKASDVPMTSATIASITVGVILCVVAGVTAIVLYSQKKKKESN